MIYERIILERPDTKEDVLYDEFEVKKEIAELMKAIQPNEIYTDLFKLKSQTKKEVPIKPKVKNRKIKKSVRPVSCWLPGSNKRH